MFNLKFSKMMKDIQWSFISVATASFAHLLLRIALGRELGPSGLGLYTLVFTIYNFGIQFAAFGIGIALTKYTAEYYGNLPKIKELISSGLIGATISGLLIGIITYILSDFISIKLFHNYEMIYLLQITAFCFPFIAIQKTVIGILNGLGKIKWFAIMNIIQNVSVMALTICLVQLLNTGVKGAVIGFIIPTVITALFSLFFVRKNFAKPYIVISVLRELAVFGFYVVLTNSVGLINSQIDSLMIGHYLGEADVGYYSVALLFLEGLILIPDSVQYVTTPAIANFYGKKDFKNIIQLTRSSVLKVFTVTLFFSIILLIFGQSLIQILFKDSFLPAYYPLLVLLIGYSIYAPILAINGTLSCIGKVTVMFKISVVCVIINILLNILLISKYGMLGAAIATSCALILTALLRFYFINKYLHIQVSQ